MQGRRFWIVAGVGCAILVVLLVVVIPLAFLGVSRFRVYNGNPTPNANLAPTPVAITVAPGAAATQAIVPTLPAAPGTSNVPETGGPAISSANLEALYSTVSTGVVNIDVLLNQSGSTGEAAGSGFVIDNAGHIVTNNHVVSGASNITVIFHNGFQEAAKLVGADPYSDLAVIQVANLPDNVRPLTLGNSDNVKVGEWVIAIGNPFGLGTSMTTGIISATGRMISAGATSFSIPQAIQTDAAINPGNSGGPLLTLQGDVVGVNAQIATGNSGVAANTGVGFAIPVNVVRTVVPVLIQTGTYSWPWLGISGTSVDLLLQEANNLQTQQGAYIVQILPGGPASQAGLHGAQGQTSVNGVTVPTGGDVIVAVDGQPVNNYADLLLLISSRDPSSQVDLTVVRNGQKQQVTVQLQPRPANFNPNSQQ